MRMAQLFEHGDFIEHIDFITSGAILDGQFFGHAVLVAVGVFHEVHVRIVLGVATHQLDLLVATAVLVPYHLLLIKQNR